MADGLRPYTVVLALTDPDQDRLGNTRVEDVMARDPLHALAVARAEQIVGDPHEDDDEEDWEALFDSRDPETMQAVVVIEGSPARTLGADLQRPEDRERLREMTAAEVIRVLREWQAAREGRA